MQAVGLLFMAAIGISIAISGSRFLSAKRRAEGMGLSEKGKPQDSVSIYVVENSDAIIAEISPDKRTGFMSISDSSILIAFPWGKDYSVPISSIESVSTKKVGFLQGITIARGPWVEIKYIKDSRLEHITVAAKNPSVLANKIVKLSGKRTGEDEFLHLHSGIAQ